MASLVCSSCTTREVNSEIMSSRPKNISGASGCDGGNEFGGLGPSLVVFGDGASMGCYKDA